MNTCKTASPMVCRTFFAALTIKRLAGGSWFKRIELSEVLADCSLSYIVYRPSIDLKSFCCKLMREYNSFCCFRPRRRWIQCSTLYQRGVKQVAVMATASGGGASETTGWCSSFGRFQNFIYVEFKWDGNPDYGVENRKRPEVVTLLVQNALVLK